MSKFVFWLCIVNLFLAVVTHNFSAGCGWFVAALAHFKLGWSK